MSELVKELYGTDFNKTPYQVLLQLDRYTIKELDTSKTKVGDIVVGVYDDSNQERPQKDFGRVTKVNGELVTFKGEITGKEYEVHLRKIMLPLDPIWEDSVDRYVKGTMATEELYNHSDKKDYEKRIRKSLYREQVVPGGRIQASIGGYEKFAKDLNLTAYNCFVIPSPRDSRKGILNTLMTMTEIMSRGGGVGINNSTLRPRYAKVIGVNGTSSGSTSWGGLYSYVTGLIEQAGSRRGALMLQTHISHPDIKEFITVKRTMGKMTNANLSVQITKEFMEAVKRDDDWKLIFPDTKHPEYDEKWAVEYLDIHDWLNAGLPVEVYETVKARELYNLIIESAWDAAEPGFVIYDNMNDGRMTPTQLLSPVKGAHTFILNKAIAPVEKVVPWNNTFYYQKNVCTNPCGEQPLPGFGICNLIHINLAVMFDENKNDVDWKELKQVIHDTVRFADNVIDYTKYFIEENEKVQKEQRRIGMGTMGLHDLLLDLKLRYGSDESVVFIDKLYSFIKNEAYRASAYLAKERGKFEKFDLRILEARVPSSLDKDVKDLIKKHGLRNSHLLTQAPTGTTGTKTGAKGYSVSTGIEPFFAIAWERESRMGKTLDYLGKAKAYLEATGETVLPDYFVSAMGVHEDGTPEITPIEHVKVQSAIQKHNDSAISKTTNAPNNYTIEQTAELYQYGVDMDLVGITLYRDGSRDVQVLTKVEDKEEVVVEEKSETQFYKRPTRLVGETIQTPTPFGKAYVTINRHPLAKNIEEVFITLGKTGADIAAIADGMAIALTGLLSPRISNLSEAEKVDWIIKKFKGITGQTSVGFGPQAVSSLPDAIAKVFIESNNASENEEFLGEVELVPTTVQKKNNVDSVDICPNCGRSTFVKQDGCTTCLPDLGGCGHSKC